MIINRVIGGKPGASAAIKVIGQITSADTVYAEKDGKRINGVWHHEVIQNPQYLRWVITKRRSTGDSVLQMSEFKLLNQDDEYYVWSDETITSSLLPTGTAEDITKIIDNQTSTKFCTGNWGTSAAGSCVIDIYSNRGFDLTTYNRYAYYTANDSSNRDPVSWSLYASADGFSYIKIGEEADVSVTTSRQASAGTWNISLPADGFSNDYFKVSPITSYGTWVINVNGSIVHDQFDVKIDTASTISVVAKYRQYLYKLGDKCVDITGGYTAQAWRNVSSETAHAPQITWNQKDVLIQQDPTTSGGYRGVLAINNKIDITNYSKICVNVLDFAEESTIMISTTAKDVFSTTRYLDFNSLYFPQLFELDISDLSGEYYILINSCAFPSGTRGKLQFDKLWLE